MGKRVSWIAAVRSLFKLNANDSAKVKIFVTQYDNGGNIGETIASNKIKKCKVKARWSFGKSRRIEIIEPTVDSENLVGSTSAKVENEHDKHSLAIAAATAAAAEAAVAAAYAAAEIVRLTGGAQSPSTGRLSKRVTETRRNLSPVISRKEIWAAIRIQTAFRGYLARRALRALRGLVRLQALVRGQAVRRQATRTFRCMQSIVRIQARIRSIHAKIPCQDRGGLHWTVAQRKLTMTGLHEEVDKLGSETWDDSAQSVEEKLLRRLSKKEAALKRERALAYAVSHQSWRRYPEDAHAVGTDLDIENFHWGRAWLERWMAARSREGPLFDTDDFGQVRVDPREADMYVPTNCLIKLPDLMKGGVMPCEPEVADCSPVTLTPQRQSFRLDANAEERSLGGSVSSACSLSRNFGRLRSVKEGAATLGDDDSVGSSPHVPNYMSTTHSAKAKAKLRSLSTPKQRTGKRFENEHLSVRSARKRLSFPSIDVSIGSAMSTPAHPRVVASAGQSPSGGCFPIPVGG